VTVYKPRNSPYYCFDFRRGGRRVHGSTRRLSRSDAEVVEQAEIERAEREIYAARAASMSSPDAQLLLPRHVVRAPLMSGGWKHSFIIPAKARRAGCPVRSEVLGYDYQAAVARAENVLLPAFDAWQAEHLAGMKRPEATTKPPVEPNIASPQIGVYLLLIKGKVVYVGSSLQMPKRVVQHRRNGRPFDQVFYIATERGQHLKLEATLINAIDPVQNRLGRPGQNTGEISFSKQPFDS
jgi:hypothetical protein